MTTDDEGHATTDTVAARLQDGLGDDYRIERELGGGGMSRVFLAHDVALARDVVVKVLPEDVAEGISRERFRREVLLSANLQHPNIVGVLAAGDAGGLPYFVMPYVDGESLRTKLTTDGAMSIPHTVSVLRDVARALAFAHERGVVHRDIKPDNVLLAGGAAIVADFGVAKALANARRRREHTQGSITTAGISLGTPAYMAPEQVAGDPSTDARADIYALGVMTYEMLTGRTPFAGRGVTEMMQAHLVEEPAPLRPLRGGIPAPLASLVMQCLEKEPSRRPASAAELLVTLDDPSVVSGAVTSSAYRSIEGARPPSTLWRWGALIAVIAVMAVLAVRGVGTRTRSVVTPPAASAVAVAPGVGVLPLVSVSPDSSDAYLAVGMTDEITSALSRVRGIRVASRSAAAAAQGGGGGVGDVARRLGVAFLLEGTVQRSGDQLRVAVRLVNASDGFSAWSEVYDRSTTDLLAVQADIAAQIAAAIRADVAVGGADSVGTVASAGANGADAAGADAAGAGETREPAAYNDYLRGHFLLSRRGSDSVQQAIAAFEDAVARDPAFARAYAELAQAYAVLPLPTGASRAEYSQKALFAAERALALDSSLSAAHAAMGKISSGNWQWQGARASFERALALDSSDVAAYAWFGELLLAEGDAPAALGVLGAGARRDPSNAQVRALLALAQGLAGQRDLAIETARAAVSLDSTLGMPRLALATVLAQATRYPEASRALESWPASAADDPYRLGLLAYAYARAGRAADARAIAARIEATTERAGSYPALAKAHLGLGELDKALDALTWATASRDTFLGGETLASPVYDAVRTDVRFARVLGIVGLDAARLTRAGPTTR